MVPVEIVKHFLLESNLTLARSQSGRTASLGLGVGRTSVSEWDGRRVDPGYRAQVLVPGKTGSPKELCCPVSLLLVVTGVVAVEFNPPTPARSQLVRMASRGLGVGRTVGMAVRGVLVAELEVRC